MGLLEVIQQCRESNDFEPLINQVPYARLIGIKCFRAGDEVTFHLPPKNPSVFATPVRCEVSRGRLGGALLL